MYNKDRKETYIKEKEATTTLSPGYLKRLFEQSTDFEEKFNKDLSNFTVQEITDFYKTLSMSSLDYLYLINSSYGLYTQWCFEQGWLLDNQNHFLEMDRNLLSTCLNNAIIDKRFITKDELYKWCDMLPNASQAFILLAIYEGAKGRNYTEIYNAKFSDFHKSDSDLKYYFHTCEGRDIVVSDKLVGLAETACEATVWYSDNGREIKLSTDNGRPDLIVKFVRDDGGVSDFEKGRRIYNKIIKAFAFLGVDKWMSPNALVDSGKVAMLKSLAVKYNTTIHDVLYNLDAREEFANQYGVKDISSPKLLTDKLKVYFNKQEN